MSGCACADALDYVVGLPKGQPVTCGRYVADEASALTLAGVSRLAGRVAMLEPSIRV